MQPEEARDIILKLLGSSLKFDGHFDKCFENLKDTQQQELLQWVQECKDHKVNVIQSKANHDIIGFVKRFGSNLRAILTKQKEGYFLVLFLDKHKYYELEMERLGF